MAEKESRKWQKELQSIFVHIFGKQTTLYCKKPTLQLKMYFDKSLVEWDTIRRLCPYVSISRW